MSLTEANFEIDKVKSYKLDFATAEKYAKENNLDIVIAGSNQLQIDYDGVTNFPEQYYAIQKIFIQHYTIISIEKTISKSGKGLHLTIFLEQELSLVERIAWQAAFGSDPKREALSMLRVAKGMENPILFFETPNVTKELVQIPDFSKPRRMIDI